ncbi:MAG: methyltransferase domain-containing protein [Pseudomonadota bacterium]
MHTDIDRKVSLEQYRRRAKYYDSELTLFEPIRRSAIARLSLQQGATVLDVGSGTGLSFELLQQAIGEQGHIVGIEQCPEMMNIAHSRVERHTWSNVTLINASADVASIPFKADAALFHFTHDILRSRKAIKNVVRSLKPGAAVVAAGLQWASAPWAWPANCFVFLAALHSTSSLEGLNEPWNYLAEQVGAMDVVSMPIGGIYIAKGVTGSAAT